MKPNKTQGRRWLAEEALYHLVDDTMSSDELIAALKIKGKKLYEVTKSLTDRGLAERGKDGHWRLTDAGRTAAKTGWKIRGGRPGTPRQPRKVGWNTRDKAWAALINRGGKGTLRDLAEEMDLRSRNKLLNIGRYFCALEKSGHLARSKTKDFSGSVATNPGRHIWLLINNTGPNAPLWRPTKSEVYDRNTRETISITGERP